MILQRIFFVKLPRHELRQRFRVDLGVFVVDDQLEYARRLANNLERHQVAAGTIHLVDFGDGANHSRGKMLEDPGRLLQPAFLDAGNRLVSVFPTRNP